MKHLLSILAAAAVIVAACTVSSCSKSDSNPIVGQWENETQVTTTSGTSTRTIVYEFNDAAGVTMAYYFNGEVAGGNGGAYVFEDDVLAIAFTVPERTETGVYNADGTLTVQSYEFGEIVLTKK